MASSRPSNDGREPLGQEIVPKTSFRSNFLAQRPALSERRPRRFSIPFYSWGMYTSLPIREEERQNRRAFGTSAGEKTESYGCLYPEPMGFSSGTGDRLIACRSVSNNRNHLSGSATITLRLCVKKMQFKSMSALMKSRSDSFRRRYLCDLWGKSVGRWLRVLGVLCGSKRMGGRSPFSSV